MGYLSLSGIKGIFSNKLMSFASIGVLTACFLLVGIAVLFSYGLDQIAGVIGNHKDRQDRKKIGNLVAIKTF